MNSIVLALKQPETRKKIFFTLFILFLYRLGAYVPVPGIPFHAFADAFQDSMNSGVALAVLDIFSGGALSNFSVFALGIMPYITASIIMQLMGSVMPRLAKWQKEGTEGRRKITKVTRYLTLGIGLVNSIGYLLLFKSQQYGVVFSPDVPTILNDIMVVFVLEMGVALIMWMGELITTYGMGNGMSMIIFVNVVSRVPAAIYSSLTSQADNMAGLALTIGIILMICAIFPAMVFIERGQRRIPIRIPRMSMKNSSRRNEETTYIPIKVNAYGVIAIIFASCLLYLPAQLSAFFPGVEWLTAFANVVSQGPVNWVLDAIFIIFFCYFYADMAFKTDNIADNLNKQGGYIPGVKPGAATSAYLDKVSKRITLPGAIYVAIIAVGSSILFYFTNNQLLSAFGGTSILIMVSVAMQTMEKVESQVKVHDYSSLL